MKSVKPGAGVRDPGSGVRDPGSGVRDPGSGVRDPGGGRRGSGLRTPDPGSRPPPGFTLVELLVTVGLLLSLTLMASGIYYSYVKGGEQSIVKNNLSVLRGALQQFYADTGRFPYVERDHHGNAVGILDDSTSELVHGVHNGPNGAYPSNRARYLVEIPIDPSTNSKGWRVLSSTVTVNPSVGPLAVATGFKSSNPLFADL